MRKEIFFGRMGFSFLRGIFVWKPKISYRTIPKGKYLLENERSTNVFVRAPFVTDGREAVRAASRIFLCCKSDNFFNLPIRIIAYIDVFGITVFHINF